MNDQLNGRSTLVQFITYFSYQASKKITIFFLFFVTKQVKIPFEFFKHCINIVNTKSDLYKATFFKHFTISNGCAMNDEMNGRSSIVER